MSIDFSIIIPTFNSEKYLVETINSIKKQDTSLNIELIFSDGGSNDNTLKIIHGVDQKNISKKIIYNQIGLSRALNQGFKNANGKYFAYLNSDDLLTDNALVEIKNKFDKNQHDQWIIGLCENIGDKIIINKLVNLYKRNLLKILNFNLLSINNTISQPSVYWRKSFFDDIGNFDEKLKYNMDYDMWLRMIKTSRPLKLENKISYFRRHNQSLSHKNLINQFKEKYQTMKKYNKNPFISLMHLLLSIIIVITYKITNY